MVPSIFNVTVPVPGRDGEVWLYNTFTKAHVLLDEEAAAVLAEPPEAPQGDEAAALEALQDLGFLVETREAERHALQQWFTDFSEDATDLRVTVLTTLQCNFGCEYCFQNDADRSPRMSLETSARVASWIGQRMDALGPERTILTFFGGEPLLNQPVLYDLAARFHEEAIRRQIVPLINVITNGLLLTPEIVDRLTPYGLNGIKVTLDGDKHTHDRLRPLRGGQGTFDRIVANVCRLADRVPITVGGNFDEGSIESFPALLDHLKELGLADKLARVSFKPIIKEKRLSASARGVIGGSGIIPLTAIGGRKGILLATPVVAQASASSPCDTCHFASDEGKDMAWIMGEAEAKGFRTGGGLLKGPCEIHKRHAFTIGPDGALYKCPGFTGEASLSTGHIDAQRHAARAEVAARFDDLSNWKKCGDCSFIPVCAGGCSAGAHMQKGDFSEPLCHKPQFEKAVAAMATRVSATTH